MSTSSKKFVGYYEYYQLPVKKGQTVTIKKGTAIKTTLPDPAKRERVAGRTYKVLVDHVLPGRSTCDQVWDEATRTYVEVRTHYDNPSVRWAGEGGYWFEVDINDLPEVSG